MQASAPPSGAPRSAGPKPLPLSAFPLFHTRDIDRARHAVASKFCSHSLAPRGSAKGFEASHNHVAGQALSLNSLSYGCEVRIEPGELERFYLIQLPLEGRATVQNGCKTVLAEKGLGSVLNPTRETRMIWHQGCSKLLLQISRDALQACAEELLQRRLSEAVLFEPEVNLQAPGMRHWVRDLFAAVDLAQQGQAFAPQKEARQARLEEGLILGFLTRQPSSISHALAQEPPRALPHQLRRAQEFIHGNLSEPLTLAQIAAAAGCSLRSLQVGFRAHFGMTPMGYLTQQRLDHAHYLLQSRKSGRRVSAVAYDSGFSHLGRFSISYRKAFGCSPKETLLYGGPA